MRDALPADGIYHNESGIINLDNAKGPGTYWVAYAKRGNRAIYFDSFGNLRPPNEVVQYLNVTKIQYNRHLYKLLIKASVDNCACNFSKLDACEFKD